MVDHSTSSAQEHPRGLARKLTCSVVSIVIAGACLILLIQVMSTLTSVDEWGRDTKARMIDLEKANLLKLTKQKAQFVSEHFYRVQESTLLLQAFARGVVLEDEDTILVDSYLASFPGVQQLEESFDHSVWFIPEYEATQVPEAGSSLESLLNRSSLMDVSYRGMQRHHTRVYLAALDDPSAADGESSDINMQSYPAFDQTTYLNFDQECDDRYGGDLSGDFYDPRCRLWFQDAVEAGNTRVIITNPYEDADTNELILTSATTVVDSTGDPILGVVGIDMDIRDIKDSIEKFAVIGVDGYAYLLAPDGEVAIHKNLNYSGDPSGIAHIEFANCDNCDKEKEDFEAIVSLMSEGTNCVDYEEYSRNGDTWIMAWARENVSTVEASGRNSCDGGGFITVITVQEDVLLKAFSETKDEISRIVTFASLVMALVLLVVGCATACIARFMAKGIVAPVNKLVKVVHALNKLDFSRQPPGPSNNDMSSPEVEDLVHAFESMTTVVKFANTTLAGGDVASAKIIYIEALTLFSKLGNDRGVGIVNNNLGNVHTLQAGQLVARAAGSHGKNAKEIMEQASERFAHATTNYKSAIEDAQMRCSAFFQQVEGGHSPLHSTHGDGEAKYGEAKSHISGKELPGQFGDLETGSVEVTNDDDDDESEAALYRQLANRKFNLALCLAAKGKSATSVGEPPDAKVINEARSLMQECIEMMSSSSSSSSFTMGGRSSSNKARNDLKRFGFLLELSALERQQGRCREAGEALDAAQSIIAHLKSVGVGGRQAEKITAGTAPVLQTPTDILQQRLLAERAANCLARGCDEEAISHYTQAIIGTRDKIDPDVARSSLRGLLGLVTSDGNKCGRLFSTDLLSALGLRPGAGEDAQTLTAAIEDALVRVDKLETTVTRPSRGTEDSTTVDLCFVMDCTGSMQSWINQAKDKLLRIVTQTKEDAPSVRLRVAFVGYRDFGDKKQYERFDFQPEDKLPDLIAELERIRAYGGFDFPEDVAGGLKLATGLSWTSNIRLCILIGDAPCHGSSYHPRGMDDRYPEGCPKGNDPSKLLYRLQQEIRADVYFIRITQYTDMMVNVLQNNVTAFWMQDAKKRRIDLQEAKKRDIVVHDLRSNDNRFLDVVVESVSKSIKQYMEEY